MACECHLIDWMARVRNEDKQYMMVDGTPLEISVDCQAKVNDGKMKMDTYISVCKYQPGEEGSLFPDDVFQDLMEERDAVFAGDPYQDIQGDTSQKKIDTPLICQNQLEWPSFGYSEAEAEEAEKSIDDYITTHS